MLAAQTEDGDLRVWSIAKAPNNQAPQVIRILKRSDSYEPGPNWLAWSKNGRIVQYSEGLVSRVLVLNMPLLVTACGLG